MIIATRDGGRRNDIDVFCQGQPEVTKIEKTVTIPAWAFRQDTTLPLF